MFSFDDNDHCTKCIDEDETEFIFHCMNDDFGCTWRYYAGCELCNNILIVR